MSQMSNTTFSVLRARANKKERTNEISYTDLILALHNCAEREQRELRIANRLASKINARCEKMLDAPLTYGPYDLHSDGWYRLRPKDIGSGLPRPRVSVPMDGGYK